MHYWLHRITCGENALPLASKLYKNDYISIGWSYLASVNNLAKIKESWSSFEELFPEPTRNRYNLWRFVNEMKKGDLVIVPEPYFFSVCRIADNEVISADRIDPALLIDWNQQKVTFNPSDGFLYDQNGNYIDLGFIRKVEILERRIPRDKFASPGLYSRMKIRQTNALIDDLEEEIYKAIDNFRNNKPINLKESIMEGAFTVVHDKITSLLNPDEFEELVGWYLKSLGARVETPSKSESPTEAGDADRVAYFDKIGFAIMAQVKLHTGTTDDWAVSQITAYKKNHNFGEYQTALWVISNGDDFSEAAKQMAEENGVRLIDGRSFARMILDAGLEDLNL